MRIWLNGALQDELAAVSPLDHGLTTGDGVFETLKIVNGQPFAVTPASGAAGPSRRPGSGLPEPDVALSAGRDRDRREGRSGHRVRPAADHLHRRRLTAVVGSRYRRPDADRRVAGDRAAGTDARRS